MATSKKVSPFNIERQEDGWDDWSDDDEDAEEQTALVDQEYGLPPPKMATSMAATNGRASSYSPNNSPSSLPTSPFRYLAIPVVALVLLFLLYGNGNSNGNGNGSSNYDEKPPKSHSSGNDVGASEGTTSPHLVVIGERHSGLPWMKSKLQECFPDAPVSTSLQRIGYFFQDEASFSSQHPTIVVHMTLNVYDWIEQMRTDPEYMPRHLVRRDTETGRVTPMEWREFLSTPWALEERPARDLPFENRTGHVCQMQFEYNRVMSCIEEEPPANRIDNPIYELQPNGTKYPSILELRAAKLRNHKAVGDWAAVEHLITLPYESVGDHLDDRVLQAIEETTGWERACTGTALAPILSLASDGDMTLELIDYLAEHVDWDAEALADYKPWGDAEIAKYEITHETTNNQFSEQPEQSDAPTEEEGTASNGESSGLDKGDNEWQGDDKNGDDEIDGDDEVSTNDGSATNETSPEEIGDDEEQGDVDDDDLKDDDDTTGESAVSKNEDDNDDEIAPEEIGDDEEQSDVDDDDLQGDDAIQESATSSNKGGDNETTSGEVGDDKEHEGVGDDFQGDATTNESSARNDTVLEEISDVDGEQGEEVNNDDETSSKESFATNGTIVEEIGDDEASTKESVAANETTVEEIGGDEASTQESVATNDTFPKETGDDVQQGGKGNEVLTAESVASNETAPEGTSGGHGSQGDNNDGELPTNEGNAINETFPEDFAGVNEQPTGSTESDKELDQNITNVEEGKSANAEGTRSQNNGSDEGDERRRKER